MGESSHGGPNVVGGAELLAKKSAVDEHGKLRRLRIQGLVFRPRGRYHMKMVF